MVDYNTCIFRKITREENDETLSSVILAPLLKLEMSGSKEHIMVSPLEEGEDYIYSLYSRMFDPEGGIRWKDIEWGFHGREQRGYKTYTHRITRIEGFSESARLARLMLKCPTLLERIEYKLKNAWGSEDVYNVKEYLTDPEHSKAKFLGERLPPKGVFYYDKDNKRFTKVDDF